LLLWLWWDYNAITEETLFGGIFQLQEVCSQSIAHFEDDPFEDEVCEGRPLEL